MKKKVLALILAVTMCFSLPLTTCAYAVTLPKAGDVFGAMKKDTENAVGAIAPLTKLSASLLKSLTPYLRDVLLTEDNLQTVQNLGKSLLARAITKLQASAKGNTQSIKQAIAEIFGKPVAPPPTPSDEPTQPDEVSDFQITVGELSDILKKYIFVKLDDAPEIAEIIARDSSIDYHSFTDGNGTLYITVDIEENPEIFNYTVFRLVVEELYNRQNEELLRDSQGRIDYVMSYEHIAGELAMHIILLALASEAMHITGSRNKLLVGLYKSAAEATLNIDEARVSTETISIFGILITAFIRFNTYRILGII